MMNQVSVALISDEPTFRYVASGWLESAGYRVVPALDEQGCEALLGTERLGAVLIEVTAETGFSASRMVDVIWANPLTRWLPVVVCSADPGFYTWQAQYLALRGCRVLGKPLDRDMLLDVVNAVTLPDIASVIPDATHLALDSVPHLPHDGSAGITQA